MSQLEPYLFFNGNCAEADALLREGARRQARNDDEGLRGARGQRRSLPGARSPDAVLHACVMVEGRRLMASDWMSPEPYPGINGVSISLVYPTVEEAKRKFDALAKGGKVVMPLDKTFWVESFGMLTDKFGANWMVNGGKPAMYRKGDVHLKQVASPV